MKQFLVFLAFPLLLPGCLVPSQSYQPVQYYDLTVGGEQSGEGYDIVASLEIGRFDTVGPYARRMVYRKDTHRLVQDEYNRWIEPPAQLARHAVYRVLAGMDLFTTVSMAPAPNADLRLEATVLRWETDPELNAVIEINVRLLSLGPDTVLMSRHYVKRQPLAAPGPEQFAQAASTGVQQVIAGAVEDIVEACQEFRRAQNGESE